MSYTILVINPGSTSTKIAMFSDDREEFTEDIQHSANDLAAFKNIWDQFEYRKSLVTQTAKSKGVHMEKVDAFAARGGGLASAEGGVYAVNERMLSDTATHPTGIHPSILAARIAYELSNEWGGKAFIVDPPSLDEFTDVARVTGFSEVWRSCHSHALNQKMVARLTADRIGKPYTQCNLIGCHLGGGVSVAAHRKGRMVDSTDTINGDGPMSPTRTGSMTMGSVMDLCYSGQYTKVELYDRMTRKGGLVSHLGTSDLREVHALIAAGDGYAKLIYEAFRYGLAKNVGMMAATLKGDVDGIFLTGGIARDGQLTAELIDDVKWIAPVYVFPGEYEMLALASGAFRVLSGQEESKEYTGESNWKIPRRDVARTR